MTLSIERGIYQKSLCNLLDPDQWIVNDEKRPTRRLPRNVPPRIDRKYPTFIVMTATILNNHQQQEWKRNRARGNLQQVPNSSNYDI